MVRTAKVFDGKMQWIELKCILLLIGLIVLQLYCTVLYCTVLYCTVLYCSVLYCTVLYCTVLYYAVLYCTIQLMVRLYCYLATLYATYYCVLIARTDNVCNQHLVALWLIMCTVQCSTCTVCSTIQYCTLHYRAQYSTVHYSTEQNSVHRAIKILNCFNHLIFSHAPCSSVGQQMDIFSSFSSSITPHSGILVHKYTGTRRTIKMCTLNLRIPESKPLVLPYSAAQHCLIRSISHDRWRYCPFWV